jgi:hypothetical protein
MLFVGDTQTHTHTDTQIFTHYSGISSHSQGSLYTILDSYVCDSKIWIQIRQKEKKRHPHGNTQQPKIESQITRQRIPTPLLGLASPSLGLALPPTSLQCITSKPKAICTRTAIAWTCMAAWTLIAVIWTSHRRLDSHRRRLDLRCRLVYRASRQNPTPPAFASPLLGLAWPLGLS